MNNIFLFLISLLFISTFYGQMNDCSDPIVNGCSSSSFVFTSIGDDFDDFPVNSTSAGCLESGDNQFVYLVLTANSSGLLEWSVRGDAGTGFLDWAIWPFDPNSPCTGLNAGTLAPLACLWATSNDGFTGMCSSTNLPSGADALNFQPPIMLTPGQIVLLGISNYNNGLEGQNISLSFFDENLITCVPHTPDQTICLGDTAIVNIISPGLINPTYNWLTTNNVSDLTSGINVLVNPNVTTDYQVAVHQDAIGSQITFDTIISFRITVVNPSLPNAGIDQIVCLDSPILLNGTISTSTDLYGWTNSFVGTTPIPTVSYLPNSASLTPSVNVNQPGIYTFVLTETNPVCPVVTDTCQIIVLEVTQTVTKIDPSCFGLLNGEIHITSILGTEFSNDNGGTWQISPDFAGVGAGLYIVCSRNTLGCEKCSSITIVNPPNVLLTVSNDTLICQNGTANLSCTMVGGTSCVYHWDMTSNTGNIQQVSPLINTTYSVYVENQNGCISNTDSINVTLRPGLSGTITPSDTVCSNETKTLSATGIGGNNGPFDFVWSTLENGNGLSHFINVTPTTSRNYSVLISDGCETTPITLYDTLSVESVITPSFICDLDRMCEPAVFVLHNTTDPTLLDHISWNISNGSSYGDIDLLVTAEISAGNYAVELNTISKQGCTNSLTVNNFLLAYPKPDAVFDYYPNPVKMLNTNVQIENSTSGAVSYQWTFEDGIPFNSTEEKPKVFFPDGIPGKYEVILIATSEFGCIDTAKLDVIVVEEVILYAPNSFTPDGDSFNQTWKIVAEGIDLANFELYIFNRWGEKVWESHNINDSWDGVYQSKNVPEGAYSWTLNVKDLFTDAKYYYNGHINLLR